MKSLSMKKVMSILACMVMVLVGGVLLASCGGTKTNNDVVATPTDKVVDFGGRTDWQNAEDLKLTYLGDNNYKAEGSAAIMSAEQGAAWGCDEGSMYVILSIKMETGATLKTGWRTSADEEFGKGEGSNKDYSGTEGVKEFVLGLSNGSTPTHTENPVWRCEVTNPVEEGETPTTVVFTIDFSALYE